MIPDNINKDNEFNGIFCLEGEWEPDLRDQGSIKSIVDFITLNQGANGCPMRAPIYRRVATPDAFKYYLSCWPNYAEYKIGYFAAHGENSKIRFNKKFLPINDIGGILSESCKDKHLILSICEGLPDDDDKIEAFRKKTKAKSVSGYKRKPDWMEGGAFDMLLISCLIYYQQPSHAHDWLLKNCTGLIDKYGFVMNYRTRS